MLGWSAYTLLQPRVGENASLLGRVNAFGRRPGALSRCRSPRMRCGKRRRRCSACAPPARISLRGVVLGTIAYGGFAYLTGQFGAARASVGVVPC